MYVLILSITPVNNSYNIKLLKNIGTTCTIKVDIDGVEKEYHLAKTNTKEFIYLPTITYGQHNLKITVVSGTLDVDSLIVIK